MGIPRKRFISGSVFLISPSPFSGHRVGIWSRIGIHALFSGARRRKAGQSQSQSGNFPTSFCSVDCCRKGGCFVVSLLYLHVLAAQVKAVRGRSATDGEKLQHVTGAGINGIHKIVGGAN